MRVAWDLAPCGSVQSMEMGPGVEEYSANSRGPTISMAAAPETNWEWQAMAATLAKISAAMQDQSLDAVLNEKEETA